MSHLPSLYHEINAIDRAKPVNLRIVVDTRHLHPYADQGRLAQFARRNRVFLKYVFSGKDKEKVFSVHQTRG